jgi:hypothetical protein
MNATGINIMDAVLECDYLNNNKDYIISIFFDIFMGKKCNMFIITRYSEKTLKYEKILVVRWSISVTLNGKNYDIPILVYLPKLFPAEAPEIYIEKTDEVGVNQRSQYVDKTTLRIYVPTIKNWNMSTSSLSNVLGEIYEEFFKIFPVYKLDIRDRGKYNYGNNCFLNPDCLQNVSFDAPSKSDQNSNKNPDNLGYINDSNSANYKKPNNNIILNQLNEIDLRLFGSHAVKKPQVPSFSNDQIKKIYINEIISATVPKIKREITKFRSDENKLKNYQREYSQQIQQIKQLADKKDSILNTIQGLSADAQDQVVMLKYYIESNLSKELSKDNIDNFIKISNPDKIKIVTSEAVLEDFLFYIKKGYEKKIFNFQDTIKMTRNYSRELFMIKYMKDKK